MTLYHLYTIAGLIMAIMLLHRLLWGPKCNHEWEVAVERELPAPAEILGKDELAQWRRAEHVYAAARKRFYAVLRCKKCPHTKEFSALSGGDL